MGDSFLECSVVEEVSEQYLSDFMLDDDEYLPNSDFVLEDHSHDADGDDHREPVTVQTIRRHGEGRKIKTRTDYDETKSKRAKARAKVLETHGSIGANGRAKGTIRQIGGTTEWLDRQSNAWYAAAPLDNYRHQIILEDNAHDAYDFPPDQGEGTDDITTVPIDDHLGQKHWNFGDKSSWANIEDTNGSKVMSMVGHPRVGPRGRLPGFMTYDGLVMLDPDDHPIIDFPGVPRLFSSQVEGGRLEALRRTCRPWLRLPHIRARMPRQILKNGVPEPLHGLSTLAQRADRFRKANNVPAWEKTRRNDKKIKPVQQNKARPVEEDSDIDLVADLQPSPEDEVERQTISNGLKSPDALDLHDSTEEPKEKENGKLKRNTKGKAADRSSSSAVKRKSSTDAKADFANPSRSKRQRSRPLGRYIRMIARPNCNYSPQTKPSISSSNLNEPDLLDVAPTSIRQQISIKAALSYTIADYKYYNLHEPPPTTSKNSYLFQYQEIQNSFNDIWLVADEAPPQLIGLSEWFGSFDAVPVPNVADEILEHLLLPNDFGDLLPNFVEEGLDGAFQEPADEQEIALN